MTRNPAVAGQFYPADPVELAGMVDAMLSAAPDKDPGGKLIAVQVPHAGFQFSGPTAARAFRLLSGLKSPTVVMLGPSHRVMVTGGAVFAQGGWQTPLGRVAVDEELAAALIGQDELFRALPEAHRLEHSLEVQLPFLQRVLGDDFRIVPIMLLQPSLPEAERMGRALAEVCRDRNVVLVISTDLYHGESYEDALRYDSLTVELIAGPDPAALYSALAAGRAQACGGYATVVGMVAARELGADRTKVLGVTNSNDVMGVREGYCVGYSAVAYAAGFEPQRHRADEEDSGQDSDELSRDEKRVVLELARRTVEEYVRHRRRPGLPEATGRLAELRGVFVTLHRNGALRGCIGYVEAVKPLLEAVQDMAVSAATEDPRFPPVRPEELDAIDVEVTVLSPLRRTDPASVEVGRHGLVVRRGPRSGLLLPQVPVEQGWNREEFLAHTCHKAGLPPNAWQDPATELWSFTGQVFGEKQR